MNAQILIDRIQTLCRQNGANPRNVEVNYRHSNNSDVYPIKHAWEDLFDEEYNTTLTSISLVSFGGKTK
jgi:hypothetical protein